MRIGLILPEAPQYSETFFNYKIKCLKESGNDVTVFSGKRTKNKFFFKHISAYPVYKNKKIRQFVLFLFVFIKTFITAPVRSVKLIRKEIKDGNEVFTALKILYMNAHIITHKLEWIHFGYATMSVNRENLSGVMKAKTGVSFRGYDINIYPLKNPGCYKKLWKRVDKVHSISDYLYAKAIKLGLPVNVSYKKISPAVDISLFKFKNDAGGIKTPLRILSIGRLSWIKNFETAISAVKILKDGGTDVIYTIAGSGSEFERLKFAVYQSGLEENIIFSGKKDHKEIAKLMNESDIYLQPSYQEGFCVSVLEAQATGLLCIVSDADGLKENVIDGETGWIVPKRDPEGFAGKITEVINTPFEKRKETALKARHRVEKEFSLEDQKKKFIEFFKD